MLNFHGALHFLLCSLKTQDLYSSWGPDKYTFPVDMTQPSKMLYGIFRHSVKRYIR